MTSNRRRKAVIEFPSELEVVLIRDFDAPMQLVFDVMTKPEHVIRTIAPYGEEVKVCSIDLRPGGDYRYVFVTEDGLEMTFHGTYLEVEPPTRTVETWIYDGWPDAEAVETMQLKEADGVTTMTWTLAFADQAGRDHMRQYDGIEANMANVEDLLWSLLDAQAD